jgi:hypothetical protein
VEIADIQAVACVGRGLLVEPIPAAATYAAHESFASSFFAEIIRQVYRVPTSFRANFPYL